MFVQLQTLNTGQNMPKVHREVAVNLTLDISKFKRHSINIATFVYKNTNANFQPK